MKQITNIDKIYHIHSDWKPSNMAFIKSIHIVHDDMIIIFLCQKRHEDGIWPDTTGKFFEIKMSFIKVSNLKIDFDGGRWHQLMGFNILNISDRSWENINFQIDDYENGTIKFTCREIKINSISNYDVVDFN